MNGFNKIFILLPNVVFFISICLIYVNCSNFNSMSKNSIQVRGWLQTVPASDSPFLSDSTFKRYDSWEKWTEAGREITEIEPILLTLLDEKNNDKVTILIAIGMFGTNKSYDKLLKFSKDENPVLRTEAIVAIGVLQLMDAVPFLCTMRNDKDENVRANVYVALSKFDSPEAYTCLQYGLKDESEFVRKVTQNALDK